MGTCYYVSRIMQAATYSKIEREEEGPAEVAEILTIDPKFSLNFYTRTPAINYPAASSGVLRAKTEKSFRGKPRGIQP